MEETFLVLFSILPLFILARMLFWGEGVSSSQNSIAKSWVCWQKNKKRQLSEAQGTPQSSISFASMELPTCPRV